MYEYDEKFLEKCESIDIKIELYDRYADDQDIALRNFGRTVKFCPLDGKMVDKTAAEVEGEVNTHDDVLVMEELRKVADTVVHMFKTEADSPGNHPELAYKVPILDLAVWVESVHLPAPGMDNEDLHNSCSDTQTCLPIGAPRDPAQPLGLEVGPKSAMRMVQQIYFEFYHKPTKPKRTILASAANPWQQKRTTLTQECIRRLRNTRKQLSCERKQEILTDYMQMLKNSGYLVSFRREILASGINGYNKILEADRNKSKPLYRPKGWKRSARRMESKKKSRNWLGHNYKSCIFVPPTPGWHLVSMVTTKF